MADTNLAPDDTNAEAWREMVASARALGERARTLPFVSFDDAAGPDQLPADFWTVPHHQPFDSFDEAYALGREYAEATLRLCRDDGSPQILNAVLGAMVAKHIPVDFLAAGFLDRIGQAAYRGGSLN